MKYIAMLLCLCFMSACYDDLYYSPDPYQQQVWADGYWYYNGGVRLWAPGRYVYRPAYRGGYYGGYRGGYHGGYHGGYRGGFHGGGHGGHR